jgi:hypothetical protein
MYEGVDTVVLQNELAFHDELPVEWEQALAPFDDFTLNGLEDANVALLQASVASEEHPARDKNDELLPLANELARLDFKLNLVLQLLGNLAPRRELPPATAVKFNALGASWQPRGARSPVGAQGILRIRLRSALPQPLAFAAEVIASSDKEVSVRYLRLSEVAAELIQRLCFLQHRRQIAGARRSRTT